jgi:alpha-tubulin suppressor-like RCC1 family protein
MVCSGILCYSLDVQDVRALAVPLLPVQGPIRAASAGYLVQRLKIVDRVYITPRGLKGVRRDAGELLPAAVFPVPLFFDKLHIQISHIHNSIRKVWIEGKMKLLSFYYLFICILLSGLLAVSGCIDQFSYADNNTPGITQSGTMPLKPDTVITRPEKDLAVNSCRFIAISTGSHHSLALRNDGTVVAWGETDARMMKVPKDLNNVTGIAAGHWHNLALIKNGTVIAWGNRYHGDWQIPPGLDDVVAIDAGTEHSIALKNDGAVVAWGRCGEGQCAIPVRLENYTAVAAGSWRSVVLKSDGTIQTFNLEKHHEIAQNLTGIAAISAGYDHVLALRKNGTVAAWGDNTYGQCDVPEGLNHVTEISAGYWHNLALKDDGTVVAWGGKSITSLIKDYGQFSIPAGLKDVTAISAGEFHNLALTRNGTIVAWGSNETGESATPLCSY